MPATGNVEANTFRLGTLHTLENLIQRPIFAQTSKRWLLPESYDKYGNNIANCGCQSCGGNYPQCRGSLQSHLERLPNMGEVLISEPSTAIKERIRGV